jgi:hypothetical protein
MAPLYSHRQFGRTVFVMGLAVGVLMGAVVPYTLGAARGSEHGAVFWVVSLVPGIVACGLLLMFAWMHVRVTEAQVCWAFGAGFPNYRLAISEITSVETVRTSLAYGIGIHITPRGWLYNAGGRYAVAVSTGAKTVLIGTDDPEGLTRAIEHAREGTVMPA